MKRRVFREVERNLVCDQSIAHLPPSPFHENQSNSDLINLVVTDYLRSSGWLETVLFRRPQRDGLPIPWFTFPAIEFLDSIDVAGSRLVEIGSGFSSLYWARRGATGKSLEADNSWANRIQESIQILNSELSLEIVKLCATGDTANTEDLLRYGPDFSKIVLDSIETEQEVDERDFGSELVEHLVCDLPEADIVIIDGILRNTCMTMAASLCRSDAIIIVDNSDRDEYSMGMNQLRNVGWKATNFVGLGPLNPYQWTTTVWQRN